MDEEKKSPARRAWDFLRVRKIWWMTPLIILILLFLLSYLAGESTSIANVYAPV
jgi:hypothetical protein